MMSFNLYILQNQWVIITLLAGTGLAIIFVLTYRAMWRPREMEKKAEEPIESLGFFRWVLAFMPWVVILLIVTCTVFTVAYVLMAAKNPPNW